MTGGASADSSGDSGPTPDDMVVKNNTDEVVTVRDTWDCNTDGNQKDFTIQPGAEAMVHADRSVSVP